MKKLFVAIIAIIAISTSSFAADNTASDKIVSTFNSSFAKATNVNWTVKSDFTKVTFVLNDKKMEAFYDENGQLIASSIVISTNELPAALTTALAKKYEGYSIRETVLMNDTNENAYYVSMTNGTSSVIVKSNEAGNSVSTFSKTK